jgi:hypothetical protein
MTKKVKRGISSYLNHARPLVKYPWGSFGYLSTWNFERIEIMVSYFMNDGIPTC